jgi:hypothetical protein
VLRFASTAPAFAIAGGLLAGPTDEMTVSLARGLVERLAGAQDWSQEFALYAESWLAFREHRHAEALALLDRFRGEAQRGAGRVYFDSRPTDRATASFFRALLCAELGRAEEARRDFAQGRAELKRAIGDKPGHDRGRDWQGSYNAETWQREAEAVFKAKGISLPEEATQTTQ